MKTLLSFFATTLLVLPTLVSFGQSVAPATDAKIYSLTVVATNVVHRTGTMQVGIANSEASFSGESYKTQTVAVLATGEVRVVIDGLPAGRYAVRMFQDLNDNKKIDYAGPMPSEPFGLSNITMLMGPPSYSDAAFDLNANKAIEVMMMEM